jgi:hypothetical protein
MKKEIQICDRCKQEVEELMDFELINRNETIEPASKEDYGSIGSIGAFWGFGQPARTYPRLNGELCPECVRALLRWLGHPENKLHKTGNIVSLIEDKLVDKTAEVHIDRSTIR